MIRPVVATALLALSLAACGPAGGAKSGSSDPYAGLDTEILAWRTSIEADHPACSSKVEGKGCQDFQVMCKAAQDIGADEAAKGVKAKVVAAMTFAGRNADGSTGKSGSSFAVFSKAADQWTRGEAKPVNMTTCAPL
ncbi:MAG TPA: hypothetical protein VF474_15320 [Phenylobacterium sp.]